MKFRHELIFLLLKETERKHNLRIIGLLLCVKRSMKMKFKNTLTFSFA